MPTHTNRWQWKGKMFPPVVCPTSNGCRNIPRIVACCTLLCLHMATLLHIHLSLVRKVVCTSMIKLRLYPMPEQFSERAGLVYGCFPLSTVPTSAQYLLTSALAQLTRTRSLPQDTYPEKGATCRSRNQTTQPVSVDFGFYKYNNQGGINA